MDKIYQVFMKLLKAHDELSSLCVELSDLDDLLIGILKFFANIKGLKTPVKFTLLNCTLVLFVRRYKMAHVASELDHSHPFACEFQSNTWDTNPKSLFSYFSKKGVNYIHPNDFMKSCGCYVPVLNEKFSWIANSCIDFGSLPNRSEIDLDYFKKVKKAIKTQSLHPYEDHKHLLYLLKFLIRVTFMLQGRKEHKNLTWSHIRFSTITFTKCSGHKSNEVINHKDKKGHVAVKNPTRCDFPGHMDAVKSINNKYTCVVYWINYYQLISPLLPNAPVSIPISNTSKFQKWFSR